MKLDPLGDAELGGELLELLALRPLADHAQTRTGWRSWRAGAQQDVVALVRLEPAAGDERGQLTERR